MTQTDFYIIEGHMYIIQIFFTGFLDRYEIMNLLGKRKQICKAHTGDAKKQS